MELLAIAPLFAWREYASHRCSISALFISRGFDSPGMICGVEESPWSLTAPPLTL
jgi:hypothetical protein